MRLYDTARQAVVPFEPGPVVTMYTCGITPYDATHLGHAATFLVYDIVQRRLRDLGHETRCVRNITDVDDPLLVKADQLGVHYLDLAAAEVAASRTTCGAEHDPSQQRAACHERDPGHPRVHRHGPGPRPRLPGRWRGLLRRVHGVGLRHGVALLRGADDRLRRERGGNVDDPNKRHPLDFVLWQPSAPGEPFWETLWARGVRAGTSSARRWRCASSAPHRPARRGSDLIFPHHECERVQSEAATGQPFVRHWMHVAMVRMDGEKMSKSLGNLVFVDRLRTEWDPRIIRLGILVNHYRHSWEWHERLMPEAAERLERWLGAAGPASTRTLEEVRQRLDDDLDTPAPSPPSTTRWRGGGRGRGGSAHRRPPGLAAGPRPPPHGPRPWPLVRTGELIQPVVA